MTSAYSASYEKKHICLHLLTLCRVLFSISLRARSLNIIVSMNEMHELIGLFSENYSYLLKCI